MKEINEKLLDEFSQKFTSNKFNNVLVNAVTKSGFQATSYNNEVLKNHNFVFSNEVKTGSITNQKNSGRCWIFAALNMARIKSMEKLNIEDFEFSQSYFVFWEKMEKANTFFENIINYGLEKPISDRLISSFLEYSVDDGGYYEWWKGLVNKYGLVPKSVMPETYNSESTEELNSILKNIAIKYAFKLRKLHSEAKDNELEKTKNEALYEVYSVCAKALGIPPKTFDFEYYDKDKKFQRIENLTPKKCYEMFVGDELDTKITLFADPRDIHPHGRLLASKYFKTVVEAQPNQVLNVPLSELKEAVKKSILDGKGVWFACDVSKMKDVKKGIFDAKLYDFDSVASLISDISKKDRFESKLVTINHAMNFIGVDLDKNQKPLMWKVENSWGKDRGNAGLFSMSDEWFDEYVYQAIVDTKYVDPKYLEGLKLDIIELDPWDPAA